MVPKLICAIVVKNEDGSETNFEITDATVLSTSPVSTVETIE